MADKDLGLHKKMTVLLGYINPGMKYLPDGTVDHSVFFERHPFEQGSFPRLKKGGVDAAVVSFGVNGNEFFSGKAGIVRQFQVVINFLKETACRSDRAELAYSVKDIKRIVREGKIAFLLHLTGVNLDGDIAILHAFYDLGVRAIHPFFDSRFPLEDTVPAAKDAKGLTEFGRKVIREMERLGMVVDVSHCSDTSFWQILEMTEKPVVASHSNCRALCFNQRNLDDRQIEAIARSGGVIGVHFASGLIDLACAGSFQATGFYKNLELWEEELRKKYPDPYVYLAHRFSDWWYTSEFYRMEKAVAPAPLERLIDHIDRIVKIAGIDHVGIGSDYDLSSIPSEVETADKLPNLTKALRRRGYSEGDIQKIWGDNFLRVYRKVIGS